MVPLATFWALVVGSAFDRGWRRRLAAKRRGDWLLDLVGLAVQGGLVPLLQVVFVVALAARMFPEAQGRLALPLWAGFLLNFVGVDYLYYWNHRLLHTERLWPIHAVHHTVDSMDTFSTSRNTIWSSFFILYIWVNGALIFLLADPRGFLAGATLTAALDLWRHSGLATPRALARVLAPWLVLPSDHAWHHAGGAVFGNYGANLKLWDRLHGTRVERAGQGSTWPERLGEPLALSTWRKIAWPFGGRS